ncbi:hypothetical protein LIS83_29040 (plasmid) [Bacillus anthracis]|uniref:hypothetical protein n=1 Tax=Bacillus anthracis TaxID=1392 RepID=UPI00207AC388|nr:hypothetical protein [Bacillus anthracis]USL05404.1 hypothetical protein LIS83_29040 [Bacillus anthracis]
MAKYRHVQTSFWSDARVSEEMTPEDKYFYLYLMTNEHTKQIGVYQITRKQIAFELGYSIETVKALLERFISYHKLVMYNEETREICLVNWGKYNLNKGGKPIEDCIKKELKSIKDLSLVKMVLEKTENTSLVNKVSVYAGLDDTSHDTSTIRGQKEKEKEKEKKTSCHKFSTSDMENAKLLFELMLLNNPSAKEPNLEKWASDFRLMRERDNRTDEAIKYLINWTQKDDFWSTNILSPAKLRKQFDALIVKIKKEKAKNQPKVVKGKKELREEDFDLD